jgi:hypothetical protein
MEKAIVLMPESPSTCEKCTLSSCTWFDCMEKISVENAWENARKLLLSTTDLLPTVGKDT